MTERIVDDSNDPFHAGESKFWYNLKTGQVETGFESPAPDRLGPFDTAAEAADAPNVARRRAEIWAEEDAVEDNWPAKDAQS